MLYYQTVLLPSSEAEFFSQGIRFSLQDQEFLKSPMEEVRVTTSDLIIRMPKRNSFHATFPKGSFWLSSD